MPQIVRNSRASKHFQTMLLHKHTYLCFDSMRMNEAPHDQGLTDAEIAIAVDPSRMHFFDKEAGLRL
jgi:hypothetical protein